MAKQPETISREAARERSEVLDAFRRWGYFEADLDPLGYWRPPGHPEIAELGGEHAEEARKHYTGTIGVEFMHMPDPARRRWVAERMESDPPAVDRERILERLVQAGVFEHFLHGRYKGTKRFSLEGITALIPLLDEMLEGAAERGAEQAVLAMSHRGRLNVMAHIVNRPARDIFAGFEDVDPRSVLGSGDVKYHLGATGPYQTRRGKKVNIHLVSNPSHLESVVAVAMGRARAKQARWGESGPERVVPITLHGDAGFGGQGIAAECLNLADLRGFSVGGTVHVVVNNLIGFTAGPAEL
ncbi:MAG: 2-oxoglutarate dehydrogenase E1 component, partial [Gemmatimonadetes bacterium]|nr:2-oxoglutarate dehydrogenase E1 component [Gemmatimonadota bacterium]